MKIGSRFTALRLEDLLLKYKCLKLGELTSGAWSKYQATK